MLLLTSDTAVYEIEFDFSSDMMADNIYYLSAQPTYAY